MAILGCQGLLCFVKLVGNEVLRMEYHTMWVLERALTKGGIGMSAKGSQKISTTGPGK